MASPGTLAPPVTPGNGVRVWRRSLPALLVLLTGGGFCFLAQRQRWLQPDFALLLFWALNVLLFGVLIRLNAQAQDAADLARQCAEGEALRITQEQVRLAAIVDSSDEAIFSKNLEGVITSWNRGAERLFGYSAVQTIGRSVQMLIPANRASEEAHILSTLREAKSIEHFETIRVRKGGEQLHVSATISPVRNAAGEIVGACTIARDITNEKRVLEALRKSDERLQTVMENMSEGLILTNPQGNLIHWNRSALKMHGFADEMSWKRKISEFQEIFEVSGLDGELLPITRWPIPRILRGERLQDLEVRLRRKDCEWERIFSYAGEMVRTPDGTELAFLIINDVTARHEVQQALEIFRTLVDASPDAFEVVDPETGRFADVNEKGYSALGYTREEFLQLHVWDIETNVRVEDWNAGMERLRREGSIIREGVHRRKDGTTFPVEVSLRWVELDQPYVVSLVRDITERREAQQALEENEHRFRQMAETLPQLVWTSRPDGRCDYLNPQWAAYVGASADDLGDGWLQRIHAEDRVPFEAAWRSSLMKGQPLQAELRLQSANGDYRWFSTIAVPLRDASGVVVKWFGVHTDVHEQRELREHLRETQTRLQHTLAMGRIGTFSIDLVQDRTTYDETLVKLYGREWREEDGADPEPFLRHVDPRDRSAVAASLAHAMQNGGVGNAEFRYERPDGKVLWLASKLAVERDEHGRAVRLVGASVDITERMESEQVRLQNAELESENRRVQQASRHKSAFLANLSHELRTPLNGIIGFTEFLLEQRPGPLNAKQAEYLTDVLNSSQHLLQLINDILDLSKVEAGKMSLNPVPFALAQAIEQVCAVIKGMADKQQVAVRTKLSPDVAAVTLDEQKLKQILYNLLSNAVKFTPGGGETVVTVEPYSEDRFRLQVRDTGVGIKAEDLPKIFQEFEQISSGGNQFQGTGLGLALTRKLVELHHGSISVESTPNQGSTFTVILPLHCPLPKDQ